MLSHLIRRAFGNLSSGHGFPSGALANRGWRPVARRRRRSAQRFAPSEALESRTLLTAYLVDSLGDDVTAGDNQLTLREALEAANTNVIVGDAAAGSDTEVDTIAFADGLNGTITLDGTQLTITDDVTITGLGADQLAVSGNNASRVFEIASGITAEITGLTITGGSQTFGGGLVNRGILTLNSVVVSDNTATASDGGGIRNNGTLTLTDSTVSDNTASGSGGGIHSAGTLTLTGSMADYDWGINNKRFDPTQPLRDAHAVRAGERVRLRMVNETEMWHPFHLHGHTYQHSDGGARKDTSIILPKQTLTVDFDADNPGQWAAHCHNIYHAETGMMTVIGYQT